MKTINLLICLSLTAQMAFGTIPSDPEWAHYALGAEAQDTADEETLEPEDSDGSQTQTSLMVRTIARSKAKGTIYGDKALVYTVGFMGLHLIQQANTFSIQHTDPSELYQRLAKLTGATLTLASILLRELLALDNTESSTQPVSIERTLEEAKWIAAKYGMLWGVQKLLCKIGHLTIVADWDRNLIPHLQQHMRPDPLLDAQQNTEAMALLNNVINALQEEVNSLSIPESRLSGYLGEITNIPYLGTALKFAFHGMEAATLLALPLIYNPDNIETLKRLPGDAWAWISDLSSGSLETTD